MSKEAFSLHLVEKGIHPANLSRVTGTLDQWETGHWWIGETTAASLVGGNIYLHSGQGEPSHTGGEVLSYRPSGTQSKRKIFRFRVMNQCVGVSTAKKGWGNEKKVIWK